MKPPDTYSDPGLRFRQTVDDDSEMISVIRSVPPNNDPPSVGKGEFSAVEAKAMTLKTVGREGDEEGYQMVGKHRMPCLAHCHAICMVCRQVVAVWMKAEVKADAKAKMLETHC